MAQKITRIPFVRWVLMATALGCILSAGGCSSVSITPVAVTEEIAPGNVHLPFPVPSFTLDQPITFERISLEQGLSQSSVYCILQDSKGFMWFGTQDGLNKYDGYTFTHYRHTPGDPTSLSHNDVRAMIEDDQGALWIGTDGGGLSVLNRDTEQFVQYRVGQGSDNVSGDFVRTILQDREGMIWIGTDGGLSRFDRSLSTGRFTHYYHDPGDPTSMGHNDVRAMIEDEQGALWIGTDGGGLDRFDRVSNRFIHYRHNSDNPCSLGDNAVRAIFQDREGLLWIGTEDEGLDKFDLSTGCFVHYRNDLRYRNSLGSNYVRAIFQDREGLLWVGTYGGGLDVLDDGAPDAERFIHHQSDLGNMYSLSSNTVWSIYQDREGILWIGTHGGGVNKFDRSAKSFAHYYAGPGDTDGLNTNVIWAIHEDQHGILWIGTGGAGLNKLNRSTGQALHYQNTSSPFSLRNNVVRAIHEDEEGVFWLGTGAGGIDKFDRATGRFTHYDPYGLSTDQVLTIYQDPDGLLWIGTYGSGLYWFDRATERFVRPEAKIRGLDCVRGGYIRVIYEDRSGSLWIGSDGRGLSKIDRERGTCTLYANDPQDPHSLSHNIVLSVHEDQEGTVWVGTFGGGLNKFDRESETFFCYKEEEDGLPNNVIYGILEDEEGHLWLSTNRGISQFDPRTETFKNYHVSDGLQSTEFNGGAYYKSSSGEMFFGGVNGFNAFYPGNLKSKNTYVPPVVLTYLAQGGEEIDVTQASENMGEITLRWPNNFFEFEFAALSYARPEKNQYAYKLEGLEEDWVHVGTRRFSRYTSLPGGTYTLRLKGSNNDGVWNEIGTSIKITVVPPFWVTWWFRGIVVLVLVGGAVGGYRLRVRSIEARSRELESQVAKRTRELAALNTIAAVLSRSLNLEETLTNALGKTLEVMGIEVGGIYLVNEETGVWTIAVQRGFSPQFVGEDFASQVARSGKPLVVKDISKDHRLTGMVVQGDGLRSLAVVPLTSKGQVLGTLFTVTRSYQEFTDRDVELLTSIGHQIGVAVENAGFFEVEQRRAEQFRVISEVGRRITSIMDIDDVLEHVVQLIQSAFGYDHVGVALIEGDYAVYRVGAGELWESAEFEFCPARLRVGEEGITGWVADSGEPLLVPDVEQDPRYVWMRGSETRSELVVPIKLKKKVIGVLDAQSSHLNAFDESDLAVLQSLADQTAIVIENARLYERARQVAVVEERHRLARELHDSVTQALYGATLYAEATARQLASGQVELATDHLRELRDTAREALREMRLLIFELRPSILESEGLVTALRARLEAVEERAGLKTWLHVEGEGILPAAVEEGLYRIAQEALNNALKHADAQSIIVSLNLGQHTVILEVVDDGVGFDPSTTVKGGGLGLNGMMERAAHMGGELTLESGLGKGTRVRVEVPR